MAYKWTTESEKAVPQTERLPKGTHRVTISKIIHGKKDGTKFRTRDTDEPQIMLIFADDQGRESSQMYTLSNKAAWSFSKVLRAAGLNLQKMEERQIEPSRFENETFAEKQLVGRELVIEVTEREYQGKTHQNVKPVFEVNAGGGSSEFDPEADFKKAVATDDIPF
jgi:hypothetical protein